jgi:hypothetical protein
MDCIAHDSEDHSKVADGIRKSALPLSSASQLPDRRIRPQVIPTAALAEPVQGACDLRLLLLRELVDEHTCGKRQSDFQADVPAITIGDAGGRI